MPDLISAALFEREARVLAARRREGRPPFAGQWLLPMTVVFAQEAAEDALRRHAREQFGVEVADETFVDTVYLEDPGDAHRYIVNIFRASMSGGPMRFRADGDYEDARWLATSEIADVAMPPALREPLLKIVNGEAPLAADPGWVSPDDVTATEASARATQGGEGGSLAAVAGQGVPLAERADEGPSDAPAPDNRAGWDTIAQAYQEQRFGERYGDRLMWSWRLSEDDARVLDDVRGRRLLVLGCGGGQDCVALSKMGAVAVGIDQSAKQIEYAKGYALRHAAENASFVEGTVEDLSRFDDESFDMAVSSHALNYVEHLEAALAETRRVLRPSGALVIAVSHPFNACVEGGPEYAVTASYFRETVDWTWEFESGVSAPFRQRFWTVSGWFEMLTAAGFVVERILEPREDALPALESPPLDERWLALLPHTLIIKARRR